MAAAIFMGFGASALDGKGRFTLPAAFRTTLSQHCSNPGSMLVRADGDRPYLTLFGDRQIDDFQARFEEKARIAMTRGDAFDDEQSSADFWMGIVSINIDSGGRFAVPAGHRKHAAIDKGLFIIGAGPLIQLWDPQRFLESNPRNPVVVDACAQFVDELAKKKGGKA